MFLPSDSRPRGLPLVDPSHHRRGAPQRQLSGENHRQQEQVGLLDVREGGGVGLAQGVQLVARYTADLVEEGGGVKPGTHLKQTSLVTERRTSSPGEPSRMSMMKSLTEGRL